MALALIDTNVLLRGAEPHHPMFHVALTAVDVLRTRGDQTCIVAQNIVEFRAVATRPVAANGLGWSQSRANDEVAALLSLYCVLPDTADILSVWQRLVGMYHVEGKQNHDARIVAAMVVHGVGTILTFNKGDFVRYQEVDAITPQEQVAAT